VPHALVVEVALHDNREQPPPYRSDRSSGDCPAVARHSGRLGPGGDGRWVGEERLDGQVGRLNAVGVALAQPRVVDDQLVGGGRRRPST
jgi:hypothetical protein